MDATLLAKELIDLHDHPRQVFPFSTRYPGLTAETGYAAARQLLAHRLARGWKLAGLVQPRIEPEICFKLKSAPPTTPEALYALHGKLIVGTPIEVHRIAGLAAALPFLKVTLRKGAEVIDQGIGANVLDSPLLSTDLHGFALRGFTLNFE